MNTLTPKLIDHSLSLYCKHSIEERIIEHGLIVSKAVWLNVLMVHGLTIDSDLSVKTIERWERQGFMSMNDIELTSCIQERHTNGLACQIMDMWKETRTGPYASIFKELTEFTLFVNDRCYSSQWDLWAISRFHPQMRPTLHIVNTVLTLIPWGFNVTNPDKYKESELDNLLVQYRNDGGYPIGVHKNADVISQTFGQDIHVDILYTYSKRENHRNSVYNYRWNTKTDWLGKFQPGSTVYEVRDETTGEGLDFGSLKEAASYLQTSTNRLSRVLASTEVFSDKLKLKGHYVSTRLQDTYE